MSDSDSKSLSFNAWQLVTTVYGPYAFGVVSLLLIWFSIVKPELDSRDLQFDSHNELMRLQQQSVSSLELTARSLEITASVMERTVDKIDKLQSNQ